MSTSQRSILACTTCCANAACRQMS